MQFGIQHNLVELKMQALYKAFKVFPMFFSVIATIVVGAFFFGGEWKTWEAVKTWHTDSIAIRDAIDNIRMNTEALEETKNQLSEHQTTGHMAVPSGAILLTVLECAALGDGWETLVGAGGRFPIGAGSGTDIHGVRYTFSRNGVDDKGEYVTSLDINTLPAHDHVESQLTAHRDFVKGDREVKEDYSGVDGGTWIDSALILRTESTGGDQAHNNLPPYIVLNFCTKSQ